MSKIQSKRYYYEGDLDNFLHNIDSDDIISITHDGGTYTVFYKEKPPLNEVEGFVDDSDFYSITSNNLVPFDAKKQKGVDVINAPSAFHTRNNLE